MARTSKDVVEYFPHFIDGGRTLFVLENQYGNDGYAFWFKLLELLCGTNGHAYACADVIGMEYLAGYMKIETGKAEEILSLLASLKKIDAKLWTENKVIWCQGLVDNLKPVYEKRKREVPQKPEFSLQKNGCESIPVTEMQECPAFSAQAVPEIPQSRVEKSRVEEPPISPNGGTRIDYEKYRSIFVEVCCPPLPKPDTADTWSDSRKKSLRSKRITPEGFRDVCKKIERSDFLSGRDGKWAGCSWDWIMKPANWQKIIEGNYENRGGQGRASPTYDLSKYESSLDVPEFDGGGANGPE